MAQTRCPKHDVVVTHPDTGSVADASGFQHCEACKLDKNSPHYDADFAKSKEPKAKKNGKENESAA